MIRSRCARRRKLVENILSVTFNSSWALGLFPFTVELKTRNLRFSPQLVVYGSLLNFVIFCLLLYQERRALESQPKLRAFQHNALLDQIDTLAGTLSVIAVAVIHLRTLWRSKDCTKIFNHLLRLEYRYFPHANLADCPKYDCYVIHKALLMVGQMLASFAIHFGRPGNQVPIQNVIVICLIKMGVFLVVTHFCLAVLHIYRLVWLINGELLGLANQLRKSPTRDCSRMRSMRRLLWLYKRLLELHSRLIDCYDYQITLMMITFLADNIMVIYYLIVFSISLRQMSIFVMIIMTPVALIINFCDFWLNIVVCDLAERAGGGTSEILQLFNDIDNLNTEMQRSICEFALFCCHRRLRVWNCGMFYVNYERGFQMIITSVLYLLFLVQFDFMNL